MPLSCLTPGQRAGPRGRAGSMTKNDAASGIRYTCFLGRLTARQHFSQALLPTFSGGGQTLSSARSQPPNPRCRPRLPRPLASSPLVLQKGGKEGPRAQSSPWVWLFRAKFRCSLTPEPGLQSARPASLDQDHRARVLHPRAPPLLLCCINNSPSPLCAWTFTASLYHGFFKYIH